MRTRIAVVVAILLGASGCLGLLYWIGVRLLDGLVHVIGFPWIR